MLPRRQPLPAATKDEVGTRGGDWIDDLARQLLTGVVLMVALVINGLLAKRSK